MSTRSPLKKFGIWGNTDKEKFWDLLEPILDWSKKNSLEAFITTRINDNLHKKFSHEPNIIESAEDFNQLDFLIALGGDGTILSLSLIHISEPTRPY